MSPAATRFSTATASAAVLVLLVSVCCASEDSRKTPKKIYFGGFFPMENDQFRGDGIMSAINLAIRHINESPDILPDYELNMLWNDTKAGAEKSRILIYLMFSPTCIPSSASPGWPSSPFST